MDFQRPSSQNSLLTALVIVTMLVMTACGDDNDKDTGDTNTQDTQLQTDSDGDGWPDDEDCEPDDPWSYPGADDVPYDGVDNDCAGDGDLVDVDGDGYDGEAVGGDDCNDGNPDINPGAIESCDDRYNGIDADCSGDSEPTDDCDGDGYDRWTDCDDADASINPDAEEIWYDGVNQDCGYGDDDYDADGDGDPHEDYGGGDCDDTDPTIFYGQDEIWDGIDNNCDDEIDIMDQSDAQVDYMGNNLNDLDAYLGAAVSWSSDFDGDGLLDIVAGAYGSGGEYEAPSFDGRIYILPGAGGALGSAPYDNSITIIAGSNSVYLGYDVASVGDLDGDGYDEVLAGAPLYSVGRDTGAALLFSGSTLAGGGELSIDDWYAALSGVDYAGAMLGAVPDMDGDGVVELVTGPGAVSTSQVLVFSGSSVMAGGELGARDTLLDFTGSGEGGNVVAADLDGDGKADMITGGDTASSGVVYFISGDVLGFSSSITAESVVSISSSSGSYMGMRNGTLDDADGDGYAELVLSAPGLTGASSAYGGEVYVIPGGPGWADAAATDLATFTVQGTVEYGFLWGPETGGDFDADGQEDLLVAHRGLYDDESKYQVYGSAHVFFADEIEAGGTVSATASSVVFDSRYGNDGFGYDTDLADMDADGDADFLIGAPDLSTHAGGLWAFKAELTD